MSLTSKLNELTDDQFSSYAKQATSKVALHRLLNLPYNGGFCKIVSDRLTRLGIKYDPNRKHRLSEKTCPVCGSKFIAAIGSSKEKRTCSYACANTFFRSGENNGMFNKHFNGPRHYRTICFMNHKKECILCGESRVIDVHHLDHNHKNNSSENLIPLCPTHHKLLHTKKYGKNIKDQIQSIQH